MHDILLIYPPINEHAPNQYIPLSIMKVGAYFESQGKQIAYWDGRIDKWKDLIQLAKQSKEIWFSSMDGWQFMDTKRIAKLLNKIIGHKRYLIGGYAALSRIKQHQLQDIGEMVEYTDMRFDMQDPITPNTERFYKQFLPLLFTSFGCPYSCTFCCVNDKWIPLPLEQIEREVEYIANLGFQFVNISDPNICPSFKQLNRLKAIGRIMRKYHMTWHCDIRANLFDLTGKTLGILENGGCISVEIGAESGSDRLLKLINKGMESYQFGDVAYEMAQSKISIMWSFIVGLPTETKHDIIITMNTIGILKHLAPRSRFSMYSYVPYPSKLAEQFPNTPIHNWDMAWHPLYWICGLKFRKDNLRKNFPSWKRLIALPFEMLAEISWRIRQIYWFPKLIFEWLLQIIKRGNI